MRAIINQQRVLWSPTPILCNVAFNKGFLLKFGDLNKVTWESFPQTGQDPEPQTTQNTTKQQSCYHSAHSGNFCCFHCGFVPSYSITTACVMSFFFRSNLFEPDGGGEDSSLSIFRKECPSLVHSCRILHPFYFPQAWHIQVKCIT